MDPIMNGGDDTLNGTVGADLLQGGAGNDRLNGGKGDDTLDGGDGNDVLRGGEGNDVALGGAGNDDLGGGNGDDTLDGGEGNDSLYGGSGNDVLLGGVGNDRLSGDAGNDSINAGVGDDIVFGGEGKDTLLGGSGDDMIYGGVDDDVIRGQAGADRIFGEDGNDNINAGADNDFVDGGLGNDILFGDLGNDTILGGAGNDLIDGGAGNDVIDGGDGNDRITGGTDDGTASFINPFPDEGVFKLIGAATGGGAPSLVFDGRVDSDNSGTGDVGEDIALRVIIRDAATNVTVTNSSTGEVFTLGDVDAGQVFRLNAGDGANGSSTFTLKYNVNGANGSKTSTAGADNKQAFKINYEVDQFTAGDVLTGGLGADIFTYKLGGGVDQIVDFNIAEGDQLVLSGIGREDVRFIDTLDGLVVAFDGMGNDLADNSGILLSNLNAGDIGLDDIIYS